MRLVVDTGVFSAALSRRRRAEFVEWGEPRRARLEQAIETTTVIPVSDPLLTTLAEVRFACRRAGHPLADPVHSNDLWIAASAIHTRTMLVTADRVFVDVPRLDLAS